MTVQVPRTSIPLLQNLVQIVTLDSEQQPACDEPLKNSFATEVSNCFHFFVPQHYFSIVFEATHKSHTVHQFIRTDNLSLRVIT